MTVMTPPVDADDDLREMIRSFPEKPGIYIFKNAFDEFLYIGKAVRLRSRVRSYFARDTGRGPWIGQMVRDIASVEYVVTGNEIEALILESNYIKRHKPKFNILLKDDKHFPYLKFSTQEAFPRLSIIRRPSDDGATYLGPFPSAGSVRRTIRFIHKMFHIRSCTGGIEDKTAQRCLYFQMGQCLGPCDGLQSPEEYRAKVDDTLDFLRGRNRELLARLRTEMQEHSDALRFEAAAKVRDQVRGVEHIIEEQRMLSVRGGDQDVLGLDRQENKALFRLFFVRGGRLLGDQGFVVPFRKGVEDAELVSGFVKQYYAGQVFFPDEVLLPVPPPDEKVIARWLSGRRGKKIRVFAPRRGEKKRLVEMACGNASQALERETVRHRKEQDALEALRRALGLDELPVLIEAFDVSNLHGSHIVGASVVFREGRPLKDGYRRYKVRTVEGTADDFASMREIVTRRMERLVNEGGTLPQLILIDGGKGQLSAAVAALEEVGVADVDVCALAKGRSADNPLEQDVVFLPGAEEPVRLEEGRPEKLLLQRVRDEVHRFAITFHRTRRLKGEIRSGLDDVPGLGPKRRRSLLRAFGSLRGVLAADDEELLKVPGITRPLVDAIRECLGESAGADERPEGNR